jgi:hypothetical protein
MLTVRIPKGIWIAYSWKRIKKCFKINGEEKNRNSFGRADERNGNNKIWR